MKDAYKFVLADIISYGLKNFGREKVDEGLIQLQFNLGEVNEAFAIGQIPLPLRVERLKPEHYYILGKADLTTKERGKWAALADKHELEPMELQKSIEAGKIVHQAAIDQISGKNSGITTIEGISWWYDRWERQIGGREVVLAWKVDLKKRWLDEVRPIVELAREVEKSLE